MTFVHLCKMSMTNIVGELVNAYDRARSRSRRGRSRSAASLQDLSAIITAGAQGGSRTVSMTGTERSDAPIQSEGLRRKYTKKVVAGRKKTNIGKLLRSTINYTEQCLGVDRGGTLMEKYPVSEFNPNRGGAMTIGMDSAQNWTPMHIYDLNLYIGATNDTSTNYPNTSVTQCNDINARSWVWTNDNAWNAMKNTTPTTEQLRWYINEPRTNTQTSNPSTKVYRKGIAIDYMLYGCKKMATEYELRVIKIQDPKMCPDFPVSLVDTAQSTELATFRQNWQNMIRMWTINPMLRGVEPGPKPTKPWFTTIAKKRVTIGEQTGDIESPPAIQGKMYIKINEAQRYAWDMKEFTVESGDVAYDGVPSVDDNATNNNFRHKPWFTSRYYLLIRAVSPVETTVIGGGGVDGNSTGETNTWPGWFITQGVGEFDYRPSYDLAVRTTFLTVNAN